MFDVPDCLSKRPLRLVPGSFCSDSITLWWLFAVWYEKSGPGSSAGPTAPNTVLAVLWELWFLPIGHSQFLKQDYEWKTSWECLNPCWCLLLPWRTLSTRTCLSIDCKTSFPLICCIFCPDLQCILWSSLWWWQSDLLLNLQGLEQILRQARVPINFIAWIDLLILRWLSLLLLFPEPELLFIFHCDLYLY